jgi:hypothetical protein
MYPLSIFERVHIVDGFYTDPNFIRSLSLSLQKESQSNGNYAGIMTEQSFFTQEHVDTPSQLLGHPVKPGTQLTGKIRFTKLGDVYKQDIHFDFGDNLAWAGVCYLSPNHPENHPGTIFWKHRRTGLESIPRAMEGLQQHGWNSVDELKTFLDEEGTRHELWEQTMVVPYRFNRLVLFRPWMFHSPGPAFGDSVETARVVQTIFLSPA